MADDLGMRRLVLDTELLARLGPGSSKAAWERDLRRTGLRDLEPPDGPVGDALRQLQRTLDEWPAPQASAAQARPWTVRDGVIVVGATAVASWSMVEGVAFVAAAVGVGVVAWWLTRSATVDTPAPAHHGERAARLMRIILARSFVAAAGEVVVENLPHIPWLEGRKELLDDAARAVEGRIAEVERTASEVRRANLRMGAPEEDGETERLEAVAAREREVLARILVVRGTVDQRLAQLQARIEQLRAIAEREALSERVQRFAAGENPVGRRVAEVEVDVAEVERAIEDLALDVREADARALALLEVVGARTTWSGARSSAKVRDSESS